MMKLIEDLGMVRYLPTSKRSSRVGIYECGACGTHFRAVTDTVVNKNQKTCKACSKGTISHGETHTRLYNCWKAMIQRATNPNHTAAKYYTGKGISVCDEWRKYISFRDWALANGYEETLTLNRIDGSKSYLPDNCNWATDSAQAQNTTLIHSHNTSGYRGVSRRKSDNKWIATIMLYSNRIFLGSYPTSEEAARAYDKYVRENNLLHPCNFNLPTGNL